MHGERLLHLAAARRMCVSNHCTVNEEEWKRV